MTEILIIRSLDLCNPNIMSFYRSNLIQLAAFVLLLSPAASSAQISEDLLDPSLDRPLAQYRSQANAAVENVRNPQTTQPPTAGSTMPVRSAPATQSRPNTQPRTFRDSGGVELAPNPLARTRNIPPSSTPRNAGPPATTPRNVMTNPASPWTNTPSRPQPNRSTKTTPRKLPPKTTAPRRMKTAPKKATESAANAKTKKKKAEQPHDPPEIAYNVYRERSVYPLDPRKSNNPCTAGPDCGCARCGARRMGPQGRPYQPQEPGGYRCGKNCPTKRPQFSVYWPRPLSAKRGHDYTTTCGCLECGSRKKVNDLFDGLSNFRLIDYNRTDNGYCGPESDPYGCLGESKLSGKVAGFVSDGNVVGVGYHAPGEPVAPTVAYPLNY